MFEINVSFWWYTHHPTIKEVQIPMKCQFIWVGCLFYLRSMECLFTRISSSFRGIKQIELFREMHPHQKAGKSVWWLWLTSRSICKKFIKQQKFASWDLMVQPPIPEMIYLDITCWAKSCGTHGFQVTRYSQCHCNLVKLRIPQPYRIVESTNPKKVRALHWNRQRPPKNKVENQSSGIQNVAQKVRGSSWTKLSNLDMAVGLAVRGVTKDF